LPIVTYRGVLPGDAKCVTEIVGDENNEVRGLGDLPFLVPEKISALAWYVFMFMCKMLQD